MSFFFQNLSFYSTTRLAGMGMECVNACEHVLEIVEDIVLAGGAWRGDEFFLKKKKYVECFKRT